MANLRLAYNNLADIATFNGSNYQSSPEPRNASKLGTDDIQDSTIILDNDPAYFIFDLLAAYDLFMLAIRWHNLTATAQTRLRLSNAKLDVDFTSGAKTDPRITFGGAANGSCINESGVLVPSTTPRYDHDPVTLAPLGWLIEEQRTNLLLRSEQLDSAPWGLAQATLTANDIVAPSGASTADKLSRSGSVGVVNTSYVEQVTSVTAGLNYTLSVFLKAGTSPSTVVTLFRLAPYADVLATVTWSGTPSISVGGSAPLLGSGIEAFPNGWYRVWVAMNSGAATSTVSRVYSRDQGATSVDGEYVYLWGAQLEQGDSPSSYIPTVASQVTRTADSIAITGTNFSSATTGIGYNAAASTLYAEYRPRDDSSASVFPTAVSVSDNTLNNYLLLLSRTFDDKNGFAVQSGGVVQADQVDGPVTYGAASRAVLSASSNNFIYSVDGRAVVTDSSGAMPVAPTQMNIGRLANGFNWMNGHVARIAYWPEALSSADVLILSTSGPDALGYNSGWLDALKFDYPSTTPRYWGHVHDIQHFFTTVNARYGIFEILDPDNTEQIQLGRAFIPSAFFTPETNASYGLEQGHVDYSRSRKTRSGKKMSDTDVRLKTMAFSFDDLTHAEERELYLIMEVNGTTEEFYVTRDHDDLVEAQMFGMLAELETLNPLKYPQYATHTNAFQMEQKG